MAVDSVEIANNALAMVGASTISTLADNTKEARICNLRYDPARKAVLRAYPWNFAKGLETLDTPVGSLGDYGYAYDFAVPTDFLRIIKIDDGKTEYKFEGSKIYTDSSEIDLHYTKNIETTTLFDPMFDDALAAYLAWNICFHLTQSNELRKVLWEQYYGLVKLARHVNATENLPGAIETTQWIDARIGNEGFVRDPQT